MLFPVKNNLDIGILKDFSDCVPVSGDNLFSTNKEISFFHFFLSFLFHMFCFFPSTLSHAPVVAARSPKQKWWVNPNHRCAPCDGHP